MNWYAIYTKPRWEKKVARLLSERGIENYCPLNLVYRKWSDRVKKVEMPLFSSYVFVHIESEDQTRVRMVDGVLNFVYWVGKPAIIRDEEIVAIRRFLNEYESVEVFENLRPLKVGSVVTINNGLMMGEPARVIRIENNYVEVDIESIGYTLRARLPRNKVENAQL